MMTMMMLMLMMMMMMKMMIMIRELLMWLIFTVVADCSSSCWIAAPDELDPSYLRFLNHQGGQSRGTTAAMRLIIATCGLCPTFTTQADAPRTS